MPYLYLGVEDHAGYHAPGDTVEAITPAFYAGAVAFTLDLLRTLDRTLE